MQSRVQCGLTAGIAIVGASVIAITPIASPAVMRAVDAATVLTADFTNYSEAELVAEFGKRLAEQFAQAPFTPVVLAAQAVAGDETRLFSQIRQSVDAPVYVADPDRVGGECAACRVGRWIGPQDQHCDSGRR